MDDELDHKKNSRISVSLPPLLRQRLRELAAADERPESVVARRLLKRALETQEAA